MNQNSNNKRIYFAVIALLGIGGAFYAGLYFGRTNSEISKAVAVANKDNSETAPGADFAPFWKAWNLINEKYANDQVSDQDKVWGAISGMTAALKDPYTVFFPPAESKMFADTIAGSFSGVGMEVDIKDSALTVISPLKGSPAEKSGILKGDKIIKIDDTSTQDLSVDKAVSLIRGEVGTKVKITIVREGLKDPKEISITRGTIDAPVIDTTLRKDGIFVISLYSFSENSASLFRDALRKFVESGSNKLVLDLRGNPGGYLDAAVDMASWFLPIGSIVVTEDYGAKQDKDVYRSKGYDIFTDKLKMAILVDKGSASASEILAGALSEHHIAKLVGQTTYGKGSVQELLDVTPETSIKITVARWLTPDGISISKHGITPDYVVDSSKDTDGKDSDIDKAAEVLNQ